MYQQIKTLSSLIFIGLLVTACGSSGDGPPSAGAGGGGTDGSIGTVSGGGGSGGGGGGSTSKTHLFYKSGSISRVDPANPTATPVLVEGGNTAGESGIVHGTLDLTNKRITDLHTRSIIYANTDNGKLYKMSALKSDPQTPIQVSNETGASIICDTDDEIDWSDHGKSVFFYKLPGGDSNCNTGDDVWKMVRLNMSASDAPIMAKAWELGQFNQSTGALEGFLAFDGNKLVRCDQNFQNCTDLVLFSTSAEALEDNFSGDAILRVDNQLFHYNTVSGILSIALHTFSGGIPSFVNSAADETAMFFADGDQMFKLFMNGNTPSTPFITETGTTFDIINATTSKVVYTTRTGGLPTTYIMKAAEKSNGVVTPLVSSTTDFLAPFDFISGNFVFYDRMSTSGSFTRGVIKDDGTASSEIPNAAWYGLTGSAFSAEGVVVDRLIWAEGCTVSCAGGTLKSVNATATGALTLGTIPNDIFFIDFFAFGAGDSILGGGPDHSGLFETDVFFVNPNQANSLSRITTTSSFSETTIPETF